MINKAQYGMNDAIIYEQSLKTRQKAMHVMGHLATPLIGSMLAIRFKNISHLFLFPFANYAWTVGYLTQLVRPQNN
ncbi:MAG: hypothetical protein WBC55_00470 [Dehalococcoidia bacterium]